MAMRPNLLQWQYQGYPQYHTNRTNLLIHIVAVPAFIAASVWLVFSAWSLRWAEVAGALLCMSVAFLVQGIGHKREATPAIPFDGASDAVTRIVVEQFVTFPRYVLSGGWVRALKNAGARS
jgi:hypothetical protein